ncbi:MAG TPA: fasciclin domain-containing protein [Acidimicrobiia bacterium]|nr:fasciclin domain-containing protein [Acidimicrobiia bacterium]
MSELRAHGIGITKPPGWKGGMYQRAAAGGEPTNAGVWVATIALPADLTTFTHLLDSTQVRELLVGAGPFTVFAPDDDAWSTIDLATLRADPDWLARTLEHHVVAGQLSFDVLAQRGTLTPVGGPDLRLAVQGTCATVDGASIVRPDLDAGNGVVHVITGVLEVPR